MSKRNAGASTGTRRSKRPARRRAVRRRVAAPKVAEDTLPREVADALLKLALDKTTGPVAVQAQPLAPWLQELMRDPDGWGRRKAREVLHEAAEALRPKRKKKRA